MYDGQTDSFRAETRKGKITIMDKQGLIVEFEDRELERLPDKYNPA